MNNRLFKVSNTKTGEVKYFINMTHVMYVIEANQSTRYTLLKHKVYKDWIIEEIDGSNIMWGDIWKPDTDIRIR